MKTKLFFIGIFWISMTCFSQNTYVPDDNFEQALINLGYDTAPLDDYVPTTNINTVTNLNVGGRNISDLTGIEDFTALTTFICGGNNNLSTLDLSQNTALTNLDCSETNLSTLDLSQNTALTTLYSIYNYNLNSIDLSQNTALTIFECYFSNLTSLDVSQNTALTRLSCEYNNLNSLDVSQNIVLNELRCSGNDLSTLDVSQNTELTLLYCAYNQLTSLNLKNGNNENMGGYDFYAEDNPNLECIDVDDATWSTANWSGMVDEGVVFSEDCNGNGTYVPDDNFEQALIDLGYDTAPLDDYVPTANINTVAVLDITSMNISDLRGIEDFTALTFLDCNSNDLNSLNVSRNTALTTLECYSNNLNTLDVGQNIALSTLYCSGNNLTSLDVSQNTALNVLHCDSNNLSSLNVKNGNNTNFTIFSATNNPNLTCIDVDDTIWSSVNWSNFVDVGVLFSENCDGIGTYVPDDNFEQALINFGYDTAPLDDYVPTANINTVTNLNVGGRNISDLTGIEDFTLLTELNIQENNLNTIDISQNTALTKLICLGNNLSSLDISQNTALTYLDCGYNNLSSLDLSQNTALTLLWCFNNNLNTLDVSQNTALTEFRCFNNNLNTLDVSQNTALTLLWCEENNLSTLDVSQNTALSVLDCYENNLSTLDVSQNMALTELICYNNQLTSLNLKNGNNENMENGFYAVGNPNLECIDVDDAAWSAANWSNRVDEGIEFSENCTMRIDDFSVPEFKMYPNPAGEFLTIDLQEDANYYLTNINGQVLKNGIITNNANTIGVSNLISGMYFIIVETEKGKATKKMIKL